jgi:hypothetical protein
VALGCLNELLLVSQDSYVHWAHLVGDGKRGARTRQCSSVAAAVLPGFAPVDHQKTATKKSMHRAEIAYLLDGTRISAQYLESCARLAPDSCTPDLTWRHCSDECVTPRSSVCPTPRFKKYWDRKGSSEGATAAVRAMRRTEDVVSFWCLRRASSTARTECMTLRVLSRFHPSQPP